MNFENAWKFGSVKDPAQNSKYLEFEMQAQMTVVFTPPPVSGS